MKKKEEKIKQNIYIWNRMKRKSEFLYPCKCPLKNQTGHPILQRPFALKQRMDRQNDEQRVTKQNEEGWENGWISISLSWNHKNSSEEKVQFTCKFRTKISQNPMQVAWEVHEPVGSLLQWKQVKKEEWLNPETIFSNLNKYCKKKI